MKALVLAAVCLAVLTFLPGGAQAQQTGSITVMLETTEEALTPEANSLVIHGTVTLVADATAYASLMGIPVEYTVSRAPAWATVVISPSTDIFPLPGTPSHVMVSTRVVSIVVSAAEDLPADLTDLIEIRATTTPPNALSKSIAGAGAAPVAYDAPDEPCPEHAITEEQLAALAIEAADTYNEYQREQQYSSSDDVSVQNAAASTVPMPWIAVGGFALVGAGIGLVLRRRLA